MARGFDHLTVGAGYGGSALPRGVRPARNKRVLVDKRPHIAGNAFDSDDEQGVLVHHYGPHICHTNSRRVFEYLGRFTPWRLYQRRVQALVDGQLVPRPINLDTVNRLYGLHLTSFELERFFAERAEAVAEVRTSEDVVVAKVGRELYEKFFRGYTRKQWDLDPSELDASVTARVPTRTNRDDRYFTDTYQAMPLRGYTRMFERMLAHPNIKVMLNTDYREVRGLIPHKHLIFTGPIDLFFDFELGARPYRSLAFHFETHDQSRVQEVETINCLTDTPYTRVTEVKHLTGQRHEQSVLIYEEPRAEGDPYNMDQVVAQARKVFETLPDV
jgi:UDP-galactopyranose mutase